MPDSYSWRAGCRFSTLLKRISAALVSVDRVSRNTLALWMLAREKKGLDELALSANRHARKPFVPLAFGHLGLGVEPARWQFQLRGGNPPGLDAIEQMLE